MKICYCNDALITCGGILTNFSHCQELIKRGYDAAIYANGTNSSLQCAYPTVPVRQLRMLEEFTDDDIIVANWWMQVPQLEKYKGRKIQFVQGADLKADYGDDLKKKCLETRQNPNWEIMAVSQYAGEWTGREFTIVPNGINARFFQKLDVERDIDILVEGNYEKIKRIDEAIEIAKRVGGRIVWFGRETKLIDGVETISNPPQEEIPRIYQRAKIFLKLSDSEGFCLPILEAMASGCLVATKDMGGNDFCYATKTDGNCIMDFTSETLKALLEYKAEGVIQNGIETAKQYTWEKAGDLLEKFYANTNRKD